VRTPFGPARAADGLKVFEDPARLRWRWTVAAFAVLAVVGLCVGTLFVVQLVVNPPLPSVQADDGRLRRALELQRMDEPRDAPRPHETARRRDAASAATGIERLARHDGPLTLGFLLAGDPDSMTSFEEHAASIDAVVPDWFRLTGPKGDVRSTATDVVARKLRSSGVAVLARVSNDDDRGAWNAPDVERLLADRVESERAAKNLADLAVRWGCDGVNLDIEQIAATDADSYVDFVRAAAKALHAAGRLLTVDVPPNDAAFDLEQIGDAADGVVLMAYDEHYPGGGPGPVASEPWFEDCVDAAAHAVPRGKLIVAVGNYGYDWTLGSREAAQSLTYAETMAVADAHGDREPELSGDSRNLRFDYSDDQGRGHVVWFLDMLTAWNESAIARARGAAGLALWRLGSEAPATWAVLKGDPAAKAALSTAPPLRGVGFLSRGEVMRIKSVPHPGPVDVSFDDGLVDYAHYLDNPTGYEVERVGSEIAPEDLVLSFDDGPDPVWTPKLLDVLDRLHVTATFFVVGDQAARHPDILRLIAERGHIVGNHTYLHPDIGRISPARLRAELNATQRVIESETHRRTVLFRAPFDTDSAPSTARQLDPLGGATDLGYVIVGANIDPGDWERPGVDAIVASVERQAENPENHVVVLHDAGGDRSQTIAAVERLVPELRARGRRFVSLDEACRIPRELLCPELPTSERAFVAAVSLVTDLRIWGWSAVLVLFALTTILSLVRLLTLGALVLGGERRRSRARFAPVAQAPAPATVVVPAYNEEKVIAATLAGVLASEHRDLEVVVVDDGSTDGTAEVVLDVARRDPRVRLVRTQNGGKSAALNRGFRESRTEVVVTIDGDTILGPATVGRLVAPFADRRVDAVCGNVEVGNVHNALTAFQAIEYVTTQNFDRRAFDRLNCITVVPGATGAWRRTSVLAIGGYENDTLTEDADITLRLLRAGGRVVYEPEARSQTEAPETIGALSRQRFRWSFGTFQCLWKHRGALFRGPLGWVGLPNMFLFQVLFPALSPIGDAVFLLALVRGDVKAILAGYVLFVLMDLAGSLLAFSLERRPPRLLGLVLVQRFFYRQFMYVVTFRAILAVLRGRRHGWNKLQRRGSVQPVPTAMFPAP
jgi:cellulose synthase/poly-beta-1,6-N-acetylglucosamine synthase-like glycosyltransferase/spore germination protein YaaH/peptidoglycan/xylan/chitin deacetylase (PgdA/CDA1 family)